MTRSLKTILSELSPDDRYIVENHLRKARTIIKAKADPNDNLEELYGDEVHERRQNKSRKERVTHCKRGHPMHDGHPNVYVQKRTGYRQCRACMRLHARKRQAENPGYDTIRKRAKRKGRITPQTAFERALEMRERALKNERKVEEC